MAKPTERALLHAHAQDLTGSWQEQGKLRGLIARAYDAGWNAAMSERERTCLRCGHVWVARSTVPPKQCPACHSPYWDKPRQK